MKTERKILLAEKAIGGIKVEEPSIGLADLRKALSCAYGMIAKEMKKNQETPTQ